MEQKRLFVRERENITPASCVEKLGVLRIQGTQKVKLVNIIIASPLITAACWTSQRLARLA